MTTTEKNSYRLRFLTDLREYLSKFDDEKKGTNNLSRRSGVKKRTIDRWLNLEVKSPLIKHIIAVSSIIYDCPDIQSFHKNTPPVLLEVIMLENYHLEEFFSGSNSKFRNESFLKLFKSNGVLRDVFREVVLSTNNSVLFTSSSAIQENYGNNGTEALRTLFDLKVITKNNQNRWVIDENNFSYSTEVIHLLAKDNIINNFNSERCETENGSRIYNFEEGLNKKAVIEVHDIMNDFLNKFSSIVKNPENHGKYKKYLTLSFSELLQSAKEVIKEDF